MRRRREEVKKRKKIPIEKYGIRFHALLHLKFHGNTSSLLLLPFYFLPCDSFVSTKMTTNMRRNGNKP